MTSLRMDAETRRLLTPEEVDGDERAVKAMLDRYYPEPSLDDVLETRRRLDNVWDRFLNGDSPNDDQAFEGPIGLKQIRDMRYQRDRLPEKWQARMTSRYRFRARLVHNELLRVVSLLTRNPPVFRVPAVGPGSNAERRARHETRWLNRLISQLERDLGRPILRPFVDSLAEASIGAIELYLTGSYEEADLERDPEESTSEYNARVEDTIRGAKLPICARALDPMSFRAEFGDGLERFIIIERKNYKQVFRDLEQRLGFKALEEARLPDPFGPGQNTIEGWATGNESAECITYYDKRWYVFVVDGKLVTVKEHGWPVVPVICQIGTTTSSSEPSEQLQGVTWGMTAMEQTFNDLFTIELDTAVAMSRPKPVIEQDIRGALRDPSGKPGVVDLSNVNGAPELAPGQRVTDVAKDWKPPFDPNMKAMILQIFQRSGLNPVAQGESPGANTAGYTVNMLNNNASALYDTTAENVATAVALLGDLYRIGIREVVGEKVYLNVPVGTDEDESEWLGLGPSDVTDVPCTVDVSGTNAANQLAQRESLLVGYQQKIIPRSVVQTDGYGAEDPDLWDEEIIKGSALFDPGGLAEMARQEAWAIVSGALQPPPPGGTTPAASPGGDASQSAVAGMAQQMQAAGGTPAPATGSNPAEASGVQTNEGRAGQGTVARQ